MFMYVCAPSAILLDGHLQNPAACPGSVCCITDALAGPRCTQNLDCCGSKTCDTATGICSTVL